MRGIATEKVQALLQQGKKVGEIAKKYRVSRQAVYYHVRKLSFKPKPKNNYNSTIDWHVYNEGLVKRGEVLLDMEFFQDWKEELQSINHNKKGRPYCYPPSFIRFLLQLKCIFKIDYRSLEGICRRLIVFMPFCKNPPDYTTVWNRFISLEEELKVYQSKQSEEVAGDASGLKTTNRGEYLRSKYRGIRRQYIKLHIITDTQTNQVISYSVTRGEVSDQSELGSLISEAQKYGPIKRGLFDAGYDNQDNYLLLENEGIKSIIRPRRVIKISGLEERVVKLEKGLLKGKSSEREARIRGSLIRLKSIKGYIENKEKWKKENRYGQRWKSEGRFSVFKRIFGEWVFSKKEENQRKEVRLKISLMNLFASLTIGKTLRGIKATA